MNRLILIFSIAALALWGQKIETHKAGQNGIIKLETSLNHLSVIELAEPVLQVAAGSPAFKIEWRDNKIFVQPLEAESSTNLFIWTPSRRLSYELLPAGSIERMHFAIDHEPEVTIQPPEPQPVEPAAVRHPDIPTEMLLSGTAVHIAGKNKRHEPLEVLLRDVYRRDGTVYLRYAIVNRGDTAYLPGTPIISQLNSPRARRSLVALSNVQLSEDWGRIKYRGVSRLSALQNEMNIESIASGQTAHGLVAFEYPVQAPAGEPLVIRLTFHAASGGEVSATLVL